MKMEQDAVREKIISDQDFPVIARRTLINGPQLIFGGHWHSQFELLYIKRGTLELCCNNVDYVLHSGDIAVLNPYDIHTAYSGNGILFYYCIIIDPDFLSSCATILVLAPLGITTLITSCKGPSATIRFLTSHQAKESRTIKTGKTYLIERISLNHKNYKKGRTNFFL